MKAAVLHNSLSSDEVTIICQAVRGVMPCDSQVDVYSTSSGSVTKDCVVIIDISSELIGSHPQAEMSLGKLSQEIIRGLDLLPGRTFEFLLASNSNHFQIPAGGA